MLLGGLAYMLLPTLTAWGQEVQDPVAEGGIQSQGPEIGDEP